MSDAADATKGGVTIDPNVIHGTICPVVSKTQLIANAKGEPVNVFISNPCLRNCQLFMKDREQCALLGLGHFLADAPSKLVLK